MIVSLNSAHVTGTKYAGQTEGRYYKMSELAADLVIENLGKGDQNVLVGDSAIIYIFWDFFNHFKDIF